jgi:hypothetical protein
VVIAICELSLLRLLFGDRPIEHIDLSKITRLETRSPVLSDLDRNLRSLNRTKARQISIELYPLMHKLDRLTIHFVSITSGTLLQGKRSATANEI